MVDSKTPGLNQAIPNNEDLGRQTAGFGQTFYGPDWVAQLEFDRERAAEELRVTALEYAWRAKGSRPVGETLRTAGEILAFLKGEAPMCESAHRDEDETPPAVPEEPASVEGVGDPRSQRLVFQVAAAIALNCSPDNLAAVRRVQVGQHWWSAVHKDGQVIHDDFIVEKIREMAVGEKWSSINWRGEIYAERGAMVPQHGGQ
jgi:hypothetical protein